MTVRKIISLIFMIWSLNGQAQNLKSVHTDIVIYGATSGGVIAAQAAALNGLQVLLADPVKHIGGMSSGGLGQTDIGNKFAITGLARDFYREVGKHDGKPEQWIFEPHVAEEIFKGIISKHKIDYRPNYRLEKVEIKKGKIRALHFTDKSEGSIVVIKAKMFIDCSYEGDLMARAGISYTVGRESNATYNETFNGVQLLDKHQFPDGVDAEEMEGIPCFRIALEHDIQWRINGDP